MLWGGNINIIIRGDENHIIFEKDIVVRRNLTISCVPPAGIQKAYKCKGVIGSGCFFNGGVSIVLQEGGDKIQIGSGCLFANAVRFQTSDSHPIYDRSTMKRINPSAPITIGNNVWFCPDVVVLKGSTIPDGCCVASRALVASKFSEENCILGGVPAKVIRRNIVWRRNME